MKKSKIISQIVILTIIIVVINLISNQLYFRLDFTADQRYTLSDATIDILKDLDEVVTVTAYFSENLPTQLLQNKQDFKDQLIEYEKRSGGSLVYKFINPNAEEELEQEAQQNGIGPVIVNVTENDKVQQLRAYMGAVIQMGDEQEIIPVVQPGSSMEYALTTSIKKVSILDKPKIGLLQGHGEAGIATIDQVAQQLSVLYELETFEITDTAEIPTYYKTIAILNPSDTIRAFEFRKLDNYLAQGGNVFIAYSNLEGDLSRNYLTSSSDIGFTGWLSGKGLQLGNQFITDASSASVTVRQQQGPFVMNTQVQFPYFPILKNFADHPVTKGLEAMVLPFVSPIAFTAADTSLSFTPLVFSSERTGLVNAPTVVDINKRWTEADFTSGEQIVAASLEGSLSGNANSRIIVISNGNYAVNGEGQQRQQVSGDNANFTTNAIDWLSDDTGLIELRTKGVTARPIEEVEDGTKNLLKYGNVLAPIFLILLYALYRRQRNLKKRQNWLQDNY
ncbi:MAG: Gldg family protein [Bacteroidota bacterium]